MTLFGSTPPTTTPTITATASVWQEGCTARSISCLPDRTAHNNSLSHRVYMDHNNKIKGRRSPPPAVFACLALDRRDTVEELSSMMAQRFLHEATRGTKPSPSQEDKPLYTLSFQRAHPKNTCPHDICVRAVGFMFQNNFPKNLEIKRAPPHPPPLCNQ